MALHRNSGRRCSKQTHAHMQLGCFHLYRHCFVLFSGVTCFTYVIICSLEVCFQRIFPSFVCIDKPTFHTSAKCRAAIGFSNEQRFHKFTRNWKCTYKQVDGNTLRGTHNCVVLACTCAAGAEGRALVIHSGTTVVKVAPGWGPNVSARIEIGRLQIWRYTIPLCKTHGEEWGQTKRTDVVQLYRDRLYLHRVCWNSLEVKICLKKRAKDLHRVSMYCLKTGKKEK